MRKKFLQTASNSQIDPFLYQRMSRKTMQHYRIPANWCTGFKWGQIR